MEKDKWRNFEKRIGHICEPLLEGMGFNLVAVNFVYHRGRGTLTIYIDKKEGVGIEDCAEVSRFLGDVLDVEGDIDFPYTLIISSPGTERPIWKEDDFNLFKGRRIRIRLIKPVDGMRNFIGTLKKLSPEREVVIEKDGREYLFLLDNIQTTNLCEEQGRSSSN